MKNKIIPYHPILRAFARGLRKISTLAEVLLWKKIKNRSFGVQFHRQVPMLNYIVDFYCHELMLAIEIDGSSHEFKYFEDLKRQNQLEKQGVRFIRFSDSEVKKDMFSVEIAIRERVIALLDTPPLAPLKGGMSQPFLVETIQSNSPLEGGRGV